MWTDELYDEIQKGDKVWYENNVGQTCKAKAVMIGPMGWVCDIGNGQPLYVVSTTGCGTRCCGFW
jgi:hypothetical protein